MAAELQIFGCEFLSHPLAGQSYGYLETPARLLHGASIIRYSLMECFLVLRMDLMRSTLYETMQRLDKQIQAIPATSTVRSHIPTPAARETFRLGALNVQRGVGGSC
jgi:hypothetical protein